MVEVDLLGGVVLSVGLEYDFFYLGMLMECKGFEGFCFIYLSNGNFSFEWRFVYN